MRAAAARTDAASAFLKGLGLRDATPGSVLVHNRRESVMFFVTKAGAPLHVVRIARRPEDNGLVVSEHDTLLKLRQRVAGCAQVARGIPTPARLDYHEGRAFLVTDWLPGRKELLFGFDRERCAAAVGWLAALHRETATVSSVGREILSRFVGRYAGAPADASVPGELGALFDATAEAFEPLGVEAVPVAFTHNDFSGANLLFGEAGRVCVVDWGSATETGFVFLDAFDLALYLVNRGADDYPTSLVRLVGGRGAMERELRRICGGYIAEFALSVDLLRWLLRVFFLSKACRLFRADRPERVRQLVECADVVRDLDVDFG